MKQSTSLHIRSQIACASIATLTTFGLSFGLAQVSSAATISGFAGAYALSNWTKTSTNAGSSLTNNSPTSVTIQHANDGNNSDGHTDFTIAPSMAALWTFDWALDGLGNSLSNVALYLVRNSAIAAPISMFNGGMLASGSSSFDFRNNFTPGDSFGFRVETTGYGQSIQPVAFQIDNFSVQQHEPVATPFEFSPSLGLGLIGAWVGYRRWQRRSN